MQSLTRAAWLAKIEQVSAAIGIDGDDPATWRQAPGRCCRSRR